MRGGRTNELLIEDGRALNNKGGNAMAYLVTGGTGLAGSRVVRDLIKREDSVIAYDLRPDTGMLDLVLDKKEKNQVKVVEGDVLNYDFLVDTIKKNNVDTLIHLAAWLGEDIKRNPMLGMRINVDGTINVFEAARNLKLKKVVWASSSSIYAAHKYEVEPIPNDAPQYPAGLYGASKSFGETAATYYFQEWGIDITGVRFGTLYGAGQQRGVSALLSQELMQKPAVGKPGRVAGGDGSVALTLADDAARAALLACQYKRSQSQIGAFNIMGHWEPVRELVKYVKELLPEADVDALPGNYPGPRVKMDMTVTEKELGYRPRWSMKEGIRETINVIRRKNGLKQV
jgi:UDP-glucose 4-epimerase